jgi:hypothetical protein
MNGLIFQKGKNKKASFFIKAGCVKNDGESGDNPDTKKIKCLKTRTRIPGHISVTGSPLKAREGKVDLVFYGFSILNVCILNLG